MTNQGQAKSVQYVQGCLCLLVFLFMLPWDALAQEACVGPNFSIIEDAWAQGSVVTVNISPDFTPGETWAIQDGISPWRNAGGSHVRFVFEQQETSIRGHNTIQVNKEITPPDPGSNPPNTVPRASTERSFNLGHPLEWAVIKIQPGLSITLGRLTSLVSHETGHTFGLTDCSYCPPGSSAMGPGAGGPTACDQQAAKNGAGYQGTPPGGPTTPQGPLPRPEGSEPCWTRDCVQTQICYSTGHTREGGREVWCDPPEIHCELVPGWCKTGGGEVGASESFCGQMAKADECEFGSVCCYDQILFPPIMVPACESEDMYPNEEKKLCESINGGPCLQAILKNTECAPEICPPRTCWQATSQPAKSCGEMGGDYCSQSNSCPGGYDSLGKSYDCAPCCRKGPSCGALGGNYCSQGGSVPAGYENLGVTWDCNPCCKSRPSCGAMGGNFCSQTGTCPGGYTSLGPSFDCNPCCKGNLPPPTPTCGAMGGNYCSQNGSCPSGYNSLGQSSDCNPCCKACVSTGCLAGSCGWKTDNCGKSIWCGDCLQSCGQMGGDYCSQTTLCPAGYGSLGKSNDCKTCCRQGPSCGSLGGNYCSQSGGCPGSHTDLGRTWDCNHCCLSR
jgi:hypothetical protein